MELPFCFLCAYHTADNSSWDTRSDLFLRLQSTYDFLRHRGSAELIWIWVSININDGSICQIVRRLGGISSSYCILSSDPSSLKKWYVRPRSTEDCLSSCRIIDSTGSVTAIPYTPSVFLSRRLAKLLLCGILFYDMTRGFSLGWKRCLLPRRACLSDTPSTYSIYKIGK